MGKSIQEIIVTGVILDNNTTITLTEIRERYHLREELLQEMVEHGLIELRQSVETVPVSALQRIESALHLRNDLGINIAGAVLALDLLEQINELQAELAILQKQLK